MNSPTFDVVASVLTKQFRVDAARVEPQAALQGLGLDSLALMEFVFAIEDHFGLRIPEERMDPREASLTLADLCQAIDEVKAQAAADKPGKPAGPPAA